jgi:hypothetical protein
MEKRYIRQLPHRRHFYRALFNNFLVAMGFIVFSLGIGMAGYSYFMHLGWVDSLLNASMILTGMGPVDKAQTDGAKIFASIYAIYSGVAFLTSVAVLFSPIYGRFLHKFHLALEDKA